MLGLLVGPRVPNDQQYAQCVTNLSFGRPFGVSLNCDSFKFMRLARYPAELLEPHGNRQTRPGLILAAAALAVPFSPLKIFVEKLDLVPRVPEHFPYATYYAPVYASYYAAYIILNILILLLSFYYFWRICERAVKIKNGYLTALLVSVCFLLASNDVVKQFMWSPHTQLFNILVPVSAVWVCIRAAEGALLERNFVLLTGLGAGLGATAYFVFVIFLPCIFVAGIFFVAHHHRHRPALWSSTRNFILLAVLTFLPIALWYVFVRYETGGFFVNEKADIMENWLADALQHGYGAVLYAWTQNLGGLLSMAAIQAIPIFAVTILAGTIAIVTRVKASAGLFDQVPVGLSSVLVAAVTVAFYATNGAITPRLSFACIPPLIVAGGVMALRVCADLQGVARLTLVYGCALITIVNSIFVVVEAQNYPDI
jgi:hypothetical protein